MKQVLVCLHGWGGSKESFDELKQALSESDIKIITPDLPGFGEEAEPDRPYSVDDYAEWVEKQSTINPQPSTLFVLGHSLGGRIAIKLATRGNLEIDHLFLCAAAGIKMPNHIRKFVSLSVAKFGNAVFSIPGLNLLKKPARTILYKILRVHDYEKASPMMQSTLQKVIDENLRPLLKNINAPTDIFWGEDDKITPVSDAKIMNNEIQGSSLHTFPEIGHRVHRDKAEEVAKVIISRIK